MDVRFDAATEAFRQEIRAWLAANAPKEPMPSDSEGAFHHMRAWQKKMCEAGWAGIHWPKAYGGRGASSLGRGAFSRGWDGLRHHLLAKRLGWRSVAPPPWCTAREGRSNATSRKS